MRRKATLLICFSIAGLIQLAGYGSVRAQNLASDKEAIAMLKEFYTAYIIESSKQPTAANLAKVVSIQKKYCTTSFLSKINAQYKSGLIEADPFLQAQDTDILCLKTLSVTKDIKQLNAYTVSYNWPYTKDKIVIHLTAIKQANAFKIASIKGI